PGQSYGLVIARNMGMSQEVLERARRFMSGETININEYLARLEDRQRELDHRLGQVESERLGLADRARVLEEGRRGLEERLDDLKRCEKEFNRQMAAQKRQMLLEARKDVERVIEELRERYSSQVAPQVEKKARRDLEDRIHELDEEAASAGTGGVDRISQAPARTPLARGDRVRVPGLGLDGEVAEGPDSAGKYTVVAGRACLSLGPEELMRLGPGKSKDRGRRTGYEGMAVGSAGSGEDAAGADHRLDLRGLRIHEIDSQLDRFLDQAQLSGLATVVVVHGKGTGALRARVSELLERDRRVKTSRLGSWNEGGSGATIIELR
ncbi:MAG: Smr/MutS family protein, partial [Gemmatimonadota bacterium]|nr:Smr/MutS family protein [Gemmatimonadota bacterium]